MSQNRLFIPSTRLGAWLSQGRAQLEGDELTLDATSHRIRLVEAVRVVAHVTDGSDSHQLAGRVLSREAYEALEAEIVESSMVVGDVAYDVVAGFEARPVDSANDIPTAEVVSVLAEVDAGADEGDEDELLARYLMQKLM